MSTRSTIRGAIGALGLCVALLGVSSEAVAAHSQPVAHETGQFENTFVASNLCSFPITIHVSATFDDLLFFDATGAFVRVLETDRFGAIAYIANGNTLTAKGTGGFDVTFNPDGSTTISTFGINLLLTLPGQGTLILDAGHAVIVFDPHPHVAFQAGPSMYDLPAFCAALS